MKPPRCALCKAELSNAIGTRWVCDTEGCEARGTYLPEAMARRLSGARLTGGPLGRPKKTPLYHIGGTDWWYCACCGEPTPEDQMVSDRSWCLECKRRAQRASRRAHGRMS